MTDKILIETDEILVQAIDALTSVSYTHLTLPTKA